MWRTLTFGVVVCFLSVTNLACTARLSSLADLRNPGSVARGLQSFGSAPGAPGAGGWQHGWAHRMGFTNPCGGSVPVEPSVPSSSNASGDAGGGGGLLWALLALLVLPLLFWLGKSLWGLVAGGSDAVPVPALNPTRLLVGIALGPPEEMNTTAEELATWLGLVLIAVHPLVTTGDALLILETQGQDLDIADAVSTLGADPRVRFAQPDYRYTTTAGRDDPFSELLYGPALIGADRAHAVTTGRGVRIALIDTGVAMDHVELRDSIVEQVDVSDRGLEPGLHGTALAGILVARPDNGVGVYGVSPDAEILVIKACHAADPLQLEAECWSSTLARGVDVAVQKDARILNLSVGGPRDPLIEHMVNAAVREGRYVLAAAGNGGPDAPPSYPAALAGVIAVTAVDAAEELYEDATRGEFVGLSAPGVEIVSVTPSGEYPVFSGTSFATAHASGALALLLEANPELTPLDADSLLESTARDLGIEGPDTFFGSGLVDVCAALERLDDASRRCP